MTDPRTVWLNVKQAATYAGVTTPTIRLWMNTPNNQGECLKAHKMGHRTIKISDRDIDRYIEGFERVSEVDQAISKIMRGAK